MVGLTANKVPGSPTGPPSPRFTASVGGSRRGRKLASAADDRRSGLIILEPPIDRPRSATIAGRFPSARPSQPYRGRDRDRSDPGRGGTCRAARDERRRDPRQPQCLSAADYLALDTSGEVSCLYPFSATPTPHAVVIDRQPRYAMCAIDALGTATMLNKALDITGHCAICNTADCEEARVPDEGGPHLARGWGA